MVPTPSGKCKLRATTPLRLTPRRSVRQSSSSPTHSFLLCHSTYCVFISFTQTNFTDHNSVVSNIFIELCSRHDFICFLFVFEKQSYREGKKQRERSSTHWFILRTAATRNLKLPTDASQQRQHVAHLWLLSQVHRELDRK